MFLFVLVLCSASGAPVAVDDNYEVGEDLSLNTESGPLISTDFDSGGSDYMAAFDGDWEYLDQIENQLGADQTYPVDGAGREWFSVGFETSTSTVGPWSTGTLPLQGGVVAAFPVDTPAVLEGIGDAPNGQNMVTTYLFRNTFTLSAEAAAQTNWVADIAVDDGCLIFINGVEVASRFMPDGGTVTTNTLATGGNETSYQNLALDAVGVLVEGENTIAIEVHQATLGSSDVGLDISLRAGTARLGGFVYADDVFGTSQPEYADGLRAAGGGFEGAGLEVTIGGLDSRFVPPPHAVSGGYRRQFTLGSPAEVHVSLRYRLINAEALEEGEFGEAVLEVDGVRYGDDVNDALVRIDDGGDSGWQSANFVLPLDAGEHTITLGAYSDGTSRGNEVIRALFDDVQVSQGMDGVAGVLENDSAEEGATASVVTEPSHGVLTFPANGVFLYTPNPHYFGVDSFTYKVTDESGTSAPASVTITVAPINDAPLAVIDEYTVAEEELLDVSEASEGVLTNDRDVEMDVLSAVLVDDVLHGSLTLNPDGTFQYTPGENYFGKDRFTYQADDGEGRSNPVLVIITVENTPDVPVLSDDEYVVGENEVLVVDSPEASVGGPQMVVPFGAHWRFDDRGVDLDTAWRAPDFDDSQWEEGPGELGYGDGDEATEVGFVGGQFNKNLTTYFRHRFELAEVSTIAGAVCRIIRDDGAAVYLNGTQIGLSNLPPDPAFDTEASTANDDGNLEIELPPVDPSLFVEGENVLAVEIHQSDGASSDISFNLELEVVRVVANGVLSNDLDVDGLTLEATLLEGPAHGTLALNADGTFVYVPDLNYEGMDGFTYRAENGVLGAEASVTIEIVPGLNDIPETEPDRYEVAEDAVLVRPVSGGVLANDVDPDGDPMTAVLKSGPSHGVLVLNDDGSFTYTPRPDYFGADTFSYAVSDGKVESPVELVTVNVTNVPDAPIAAADRYATNPGEALVVNAIGGVLANDSDADGVSLTAELVRNVRAGTLSLQPDGSFTYLPADGTAGSVSFVYRASDGGLRSQDATVTIHLDTAPRAVLDAYQPTEDTFFAVSAAEGVLRNDSDAEGDSLSAVLVSPPPGGELDLRPDGSFTYTSPRDFDGIEIFTYQARGGARDSAPVAVILNVQGVNDGPTAVNDSYLAIADQELAVEAPAGVLANDVDLDSPTMTATLVIQPRHGTVVLEENGAFLYTHPPGFTGEDSFSYVATDGTLGSSPATVFIQIGGADEAIIINEIMYHPASGNEAHEYIELVNIGDGPVRLTGWRFTSGVSFTFPDVELEDGEFMVIAADPEEFTTHYGEGAQVIGGWTGALSNRGERVRLAEASGNQVDEVTYSDQGDWAVRTRITDTGEPGWRWEAAHDGAGESLELIFPALTNKSGQNWRSSEGGPTPGRANSAALAESAVAPLIHDVGHQPRVPRSTETVTIRARLRDTTATGLSAVLHYRVSEVPAGEFSTALMVDDGLHNDGEANDGLFAAVLPPMPDRTIVEFFVLASDGVNERTWPAPTSIGQVANALYQVDDGESPEGVGIYRLILTAEENEVFNSIDRDSNAQQNCTLIADDCSGPVVRYLCGMRVRGASSRRDNPPPLRINLPRDTPWNGNSAMNLNSQFTWLQFIGMKLFQASDLAAPDSKRVALRRNGWDPTRGAQEDYGSFVHLQPLNGELIDEKYPDDSQGNLYKKVRPDVDWAYRGGNYPRYAQDGWGKQTNDSENDWTDLDEFLRIMNEAPGEPDYLAQVESVVNLDQWMRWFAVEALIANGETNASNGADDDYSLYRGVNDPRFVFLPHDLDTILGRGDNSRITDPEFTIFDMIERGDVLDPLVPLFNHEEIRTRYHQALRDLIQTSFSKPRFDALLLNHLSGWVPENVIEDMISFMDARREHVAALVEEALGPAGPTVAPVTLDGEEAPHGALYLSEILALNQGAHEVDGRFPDYIEMRNSGVASVPLAGYSMTDDPSDPGKYVFPPGSTIEAGERLVLYADSGSGPGVRLGFSLSGRGESVVLFDAGGEVVDMVVFGPQVVDHSIGRTGPGENTWTLNQPTPGLPNQTQTLGSPGTLRINEWLTKPDVVYNEDFIEIHNPDFFPVSLGGLAITDDPLNAPRRAVFPALSFVGGGGFVVLEAVGEGDANSPSELPFKLSAGHGWLALYGANGVEIDRVHTHCDGRDESQGREEDGAPLFARFAVPTPGFSNLADLSEAGRLLRSLRITEIMYHPVAGSDAEFIELRNVGEETINLGGVEFTKGIEFEFPEVTLEPGHYVVVAADEATFRRVYGPDVTIVGEWGGKLDNDEDRIRLEVAALNAAILDFTYRDDWFPSTDGQGYSLIIIDQLADAGTWDDRESWSAGASENGSPGADSGFFVFAGADQAVSLPAGATLNATVYYGSLNPAEVTLSWSLDNGPAAALIGSENSEDTTVNVPLPGRYTFELTATPSEGPTRTGKVTVIFRDTYDQWALRQFGELGVEGARKLDNGDLDDFENLFEFALGLDPQRAESGVELAPELSPEGMLTLTYFRRYLAEGVIITPEVSSNLKTWQGGPEFISELVIGATDEGEFIRVEDRFHSDGATPRFLRLRVESLR